MLKMGRGKRREGWKKMQRGGANGGKKHKGAERCGAAAVNLSGMLYFGKILLGSIWFWSIFALHSDSGHWGMSPYESYILSDRNPPVSGWEVGNDITDFVTNNQQ